MAVLRGILGRLAQLNIGSSAEQSNVADTLDTILHLFFG
jgi:hypothetical protein